MKVNHYVNNGIHQNDESPKILLSFRLDYFHAQSILNRTYIKHYIPFRMADISNSGQ